MFTAAVIISVLHAAWLATKLFLALGGLLVAIVVVSLVLSSIFNWIVENVPYGTPIAVLLAVWLFFFITTLLAAL
jgi:hypothetical protein